jgi:hypothetical protein
METRTIAHRDCDTCVQETQHLHWVSRNFGDEVIDEEYQCRVCIGAPAGVGDLSGFGPQGVSRRTGRFPVLLVS